MKLLFKVNAHNAHAEKDIQISCQPVGHQGGFSTVVSQEEALQFPVQSYIQVTVVETEPPAPTK